MVNPKELATFAGGCFWGVEHYLKKQFGSAILSSKVGYIGGEIENPSYRQVCSGTTGHAEAVQLEYDSNQVNFKELATYFFRIHNPTTINHQGNDRGSQYRSAIFYHSEQQKTLAQQVMEEIKDKWPNPIITTLEKAGKFYEAEPYHQNYLEENPGGYCNHRVYW